MTRRHTILGLFAVGALATAGCGPTSAKTESAAGTPAPAAAAATSPVASAVPSASSAPSAAVPAATSGAASTATPPPAPVSAAASPAPAAASPAATASPAGTAPAPTASAPTGDTPETMRRRAQIQWALRQDEIKNDPHGQWAVGAKASSTYNDAQGTSPYSPAQATGAPNVEVYTNSLTAWRPKTPDAGIEWLDLTFANPVHATSVRIRESYGAGAVIKVELFDEQGAPHVVWSGIDPTKDLDYLTVDFPRTTYATARVKVTLATNTVSGIKQIDAVQLVGTAQ